MTIGPEPRTRMEWRSVRLGMAGRKHTSGSPLARSSHFPTPSQSTGDERKAMPITRLKQDTLEKLQMLLKGHEEMLEEKRMRPEGILRKNDPFREQFSQAARSVIVPVLE